MKQNDTMKKGNPKDRNIFFRYFAVVMLLLLVAAGIVVSALNIGFKEKDEWLKLSERNKRSDKLVKPVRGDIFSSDGRLMSTNRPCYELYIDFKAAGFNTDTFLYSKRNGIDSLSFYLSKKLKDRTPAGYKAYLKKGLKSRSREFKLFEGRVSYEDWKEIKEFPFFRYGRNTGGRYVKEMMERQKPFGTLASRTVGNIYNEIGEDGVTKAKNGLELQYDSLLRGAPGWNSQKRVGKNWINVVKVEPTDGMDIRSTIDINIQDLTEKALVDKLKELDAELGTAVVMEVKTGEIKAITNMARVGKGRYAETMNHAVADEIEPGSTFKVAAMMVAIEDSVVQPNTPVDVGNGVFMYANRRMTDHNAHRGGYGLISAEKSIWYSSNIGVAKCILKGYANNPKKFVDGLHRIGMDADLKLEIPGAGKAKLRWPDSKLWSKTSLPWMSFGYEVQIPPIQTLTFFNAIANGGKMVRPMFVTDILEKGKVVKHFDPEVIIPEICSERTLGIIQDMLYNVVNYKDPTPARRDGTGKPARSDVVKIAGKTGTAQINASKSAHNVSFCGYFPYEDPQYTCIVVISRPRVGAASGGFMCGTVVKEIAEKIYANCTIFEVNKMPEDSLREPSPSIKNGDYAALETVMAKLNVKAGGRVGSKYVIAKEDGGKGATLQELPLVKGLVPNVVGMGAKDAVFALENCGLKVLLSGAGSVVAQSVRNGSKASPGQTITLTLK